MPSIQGLIELSAFIPTVLPVVLPSLSITLFLPPLLPGTLGEREGEDGEKENDRGRGSTDLLVICAAYHGIQGSSKF